MNVRLVAYLTGVVLIFSSGFMLIPLAVSLYLQGDDIHALGSSFLLTLVFGVLLFFMCRAQRNVELGHRDGFAIVTISWLAMSLFGSLPYLFSGTTVSFTNAYFESMAGFTTTGASVFTNLSDIPRGVLLWRSLTQWIGGMGIIVLSIAILPMLGVGGMQLFRAEVPEIGVEKIRPRILDIAKSLWYIYAGLTLSLALLLMFGGMNLYDAACHAFTTMATGGFSTRNESIAFYQSAYIDFIITIFMLLAGVNFSLHFFALRGKVSRFSQSSEFRFYCSVVVLSGVAVTASLLLSGAYTSVSEAFRFAMFQVASIMTTTGYATADYEVWPVFSQMILISLMFFGGMVGSTGGGMKQVRIMLTFKQAYREIYYLIHPHAMTTLKLDGRSLPKETIGGIWGYLFLFIVIFLSAALMLSVMGVDMTTSVTTVISAMANVGPALGKAGPTENYSTIPGLGKWVLIICMLMGRLEIYTVIILFVPQFWRK